MLYGLCASQPSGEGHGIIPVGPSSSFTVLLFVPFSWRIFIFPASRSFVTAVLLAHVIGVQLDLQTEGNL